MGLFDWLGPTSLTKRRGWDALPTIPEQKSPSWIIDDQRAAITVRTLVHGPGATDLLDGQRGNDANSAVYACLQAIATAIAEPELKVYSTKTGERVEQTASPMLDLLRHPNPHMSMDTLLWYLVNCLRIDGNAYWRKLRAGDELTGNVVELWPISPSRIEPRTQSGSGDLVSFYRYYIRPGRYEDIDPVNVVHHRAGLDDRDHRLGCAALKRLAREVSSDQAATFFADTLLKKLAIPGLVVEIDKDGAHLSQDEADEMKARIQAAYGGENAGSVGILTAGATMKQLGFSPEQMDMKILHRVPEERIAAVLGVPAIVAGLGAGLDRATYSNFGEAREAFTEMTLIPTWRSIAATLTMSLVPDFTSDRSTVVDFDISEVRALADDENAKATRLVALVAGGILDVDEARAEIGREPRPTGSLAAGAQAPGGGTPPAIRSRAPLIALPARTERKSLDDLAGAFDRLRTDREPDWQAEMQRYLDALDRRVQAALRAGHDTAEGLVAESEAEILGETLKPLQAALLGDVNALVAAELAVAFQLDDPLTRQFLAAAGINIGGITETTRSAVRAALIEGQQAGEGIDQLARRLKDLPEFGSARARTVAITELGHSTNAAAIANYHASGVVVGCRVFDGDYDSVCAAMNGRVFPLNALPATLQHPNCRRAFAPITDAAELQRSA